MRIIFIHFIYPLLVVVSTERYKHADGYFVNNG